MRIEALLETLPAKWRPHGAGETSLQSRIERIQGGRNNCVYRFRTAGKADCVAKLYHGVPVDEATRLWREFSFLRLMREGGIDCVPEMLYADFEGHLAVFPFLSGCKPPEGWQEPWGIQKTIEFLSRLQALRPHPLSPQVPNASEACFSLRAHSGALRKRVERLKEIEQDGTDAVDACHFFNAELRPFSEQLIHRIEKESNSDRVLGDDEKWLSPSDLGFHNTLISEDRELVFLDFEHAGWDDPAKLIADFCNQPDHLLEEDLADQFRNAMLEMAVDPERLRNRLRLLTPLYQAKWACILLNEFLPFGSKRREFLGRSADEEAAEKKRQLKRSREMLVRAESSLGG